MSKPFVMPALSPTMEKGTLARWLVAVGDRVRPGDVLAEVETDKATMEVEADDAGVVEALLLDAGSEDVPVGTVIARIADATEATDRSRSALSAPEPQPEATSSPPETLGGEIAAPARPDLAPDPSPPVLGTSARHLAGMNVSPLAARIAAIRGVDLAKVSGSGAAGRIVLVDVAPPPQASPQAAVISPAEPRPAARPQAPSAIVDIPHRAVPLSQMRRTIARRLSESKQNIPHFYLTSHLKVDELRAQREEMNLKLQPRGVKLSLNDFLIKAMALAIVELPEVNVRFAGEALLQFERVDVSMAVAIPNGLVTPVIRDAARKPLSLISSEARDLATKARDGKLAPEHYEGGTASISNLGMFGVDEIIPVINPPQSLILGVGAVSERAVPQDGRIEAVSMMTATASFDHRAIDGAAAAQFMAALRHFVENPLALLVA